jgi:beta-lactam-binding protein with PASTA domain
MKLFHFLKSKTFFANLIIAVLLITGLFFGLNYFLASYSRHGENIKVAELNSLALSEVESLLSSKGLSYEVIDSSEYDPKFPMGSVVAQYPEAGSSVKVGRSIRITINPFKPRKIEMPMLVEKTKRRAIYDLESKGFVVGNLIYVPYIGKDVVIEVKIGDRSIMPGEKLSKGTIIDLVLGQGLSDELIPSPYLRWKTLDEAREYLLSRSLNLGSIIYDELITDTAAALVYRQNPSPTIIPHIQMGREIDLWLTNDYTKIAKDSLDFQLQTPLDSTLNDSVL